MLTNCPNCNAILSYDGGLHCDYCGAQLERPRKEFAVKIHSPQVDEDMSRMLARGLLNVNEARGMLRPCPASTYETR